jgi:hypothetical protein
MTHRLISLIGLVVILSAVTLNAQPNNSVKPAGDTAAAVEKEIRDFYAAYAADLLQARRESIAVVMTSGATTGWETDPSV